MRIMRSLAQRCPKILFIEISRTLDSKPAERKARTWRKKTTAFLLTAVILLGCAKPTPIGPLFDGPRPPGGGMARVYLYRVDTHHSFSVVEIRFDGEKAIPILDEEYAMVELEDGIHEIEFRLRNAIWGGWRWRKQVLRARPGDTIYMEITVGVHERELAMGRDLEIPGRGSGIAGESVTVLVRERGAALEQLSRTHLVDHSGI